MYVRPAREELQPKRIQVPQRLNTDIQKAIVLTRPIEQAFVYALLHALVPVTARPAKKTLRFSEQLEEHSSNHTFTQQKPGTTIMSQQSQGEVRVSCLPGKGIGPATYLGVGVPPATGFAPLPPH